MSSRRQRGHRPTLICIGMKHIAVVILFAAASGCAHGSTHPGEPAAPGADLRPYIGDYYAPHDTLFVRERGGVLEAVIRRLPHPLQHITGDTFTAGDSKVIIGAAHAEYAFGTAPPLFLNRRLIAAGTFRISPARRPAELRAEALAAKPPAQPDTLMKPDLVELKSLDATIKYDIRYATTNNFMGEVFYSSAHAFMQRPAAAAVARAHKKLNALGYGLLIHDAYRPWYVTKMFWDATPDSLHDFVADPAKGSRHNRGAAVDLTMYDLKTGQPVEMTGGYDEFSERSFPDYPGGTTAQRWRRELLRRVMADEGFRVYDFEWWHFDYKDWQRYPVTNLTFEQIHETVSALM